MLGKDGTCGAIDGSGGGGRIILGMTTGEGVAGASGAGVGLLVIGVGFPIVGGRFILFGK